MVRSLRRGPLLGLLALLLGGAATAGIDLLPEVDSEPFASAAGVTLSPEGANVYAINGNSIRAFTRDDVTGEFTTLETENSNSEGGSELVVSPDGRHVYALASRAPGVGVYSRSPVDGSLTFVETVGSNLKDPLGIAITPDGLHVFVAFEDDCCSAVGGTGVYSRDTQTGALSNFDQFDGGGDLTDPSSVAISPDGRFVYLSGFEDFGGTIAAIGILERTLPSGALSDFSFRTNDVASRPRSLAVSPDGAHVYAALQNQVSVFERDLLTGALSFVEALVDGVGGVDGLGGARDVIVSSAGTIVYVAGETDDAVAVFRRNPADGTLGYLGSKGGLDGVQSLATSPVLEVEDAADIAHLYAAARLDGEIVAMRAPDETPFSGGEVAGDDLFVVDRPTGLVIRSESFSGDQSIVSIGATLTPGTVSGIEIADTLDLFVTQSVDPKVVRIDPFTGLESRAAPSGSALRAPYDVAVEAGGTLLVSDPQALAASLGIARIDLVAESESFPPFTGDIPGEPYGIAIGPGGNVFVVDGDPVRVIEIDAMSLVATELSSGPPFVAPRGIAVRDDGQIFVSDAAAFTGSGGIIQVDAKTGMASEVVSGSPFQQPEGIAFDSRGDLFVADGTRLIRVITGAGVAVELAAPSLLTGARGLTIAPPAVVEAFNQFIDGTDDTGEVVNLKTCYQVKDRDGKVAGSVSGSKAKSSAIKSAPGDSKKKSWELEATGGTPDSDGNLMVGEMPGCTAGEKGGEYAKFFASPKDIEGSKFNAKVKKENPGAGPAPSDVIVARLRVMDADGNARESGDFVLTDKFVTASVDVFADQFPNAVSGSTSVDLSRIVGIGIAIGTQGGVFSSTDTIVAVDDVTIVPEASSGIAALVALLVLGRVRGRRGSRAGR